MGVCHMLFLWLPATVVDRESEQVEPCASPTFSKKPCCVTRWPALLCRATLLCAAPQGVIINGCIRDSEDIGKMPLGVKALGTYPLKSSKRDPGLSDVPVTIAGVTVHPGDWVYADKGAWVAGGGCVMLLGGGGGGDGRSNVQIWNGKIGMYTQAVFPVARQCFVLQMVCWLPRRS